MLGQCLSYEPNLRKGSMPPANAGVVPKKTTPNYGEYLMVTSETCLHIFGFGQLEVLTLRLTHNPRIVRADKLR